MNSEKTNKGSAETPVPALVRRVSDTERKRAGARARRTGRGARYSHKVRMTVIRVLDCCDVDHHGRKHLYARRRETGRDGDAVIARSFWGADENVAGARGRGLNGVSRMLVLAFVTVRLCGLRGTRPLAGELCRRKSPEKKQNRQGDWFEEPSHVPMSIHPPLAQARQARDELPLHRSTCRNRSALAMTETELRVIAALAQMGLIRRPSTGYRTPAATGTPNAL